MIKPNSDTSPTEAHETIAPVGAPPGQAPTPAPEAPPAPPAAAAPPIVASVVTQGRQDQENELADELADEKARHAHTAAEKKARENRIAELEDEIYRLKQAGLSATPAAKPVRSKSWTLFDEEGA